MKLFDITQELFKSSVYPGDPAPQKKPVLRMEKGDACNLTQLSLGSHNGTHMDAPRHFYLEGRDIENIPISKCIGECKVAESDKKEAQWVISEEEIEKLLEDGTTKLLLKGELLITEQAASSMARHKLELIGVEAQTVGNPQSPRAVHRILLGAEIVIIEGLRLQDVAAGHYMISALPLKMEGLDGSPVRAVLMDQTKTVPGYDEGGIHRIPLNDVFYFESVDDKVFIYCRKAVYESRKKLYEVESLSGEYFRASKSIVLNIDVIESTSPSFSGRFKAVLSNGEEVEISRQYVPVLKRMLGV